MTELAETMTVISREEQKLYYGGYDANDCVWRCLAYINSNGKDYSADAAMRIAQNYYGNSFDEDNYAFEGSIKDFKSFANKFLSDNPDLKAQILFFDPNTTYGWNGNGYAIHAVVIIDNQPGKVKIFDPQNGNTCWINYSDVKNSTTKVVNVGGYYHAKGY